MTDFSVSESGAKPQIDGATGGPNGLAQWTETVLPSRRVLIALLVPLVMMKLLQVFYAPPTADEAYYWLWGQNPALSYYDHPPLIAWSQTLMSSIFGWNIVGLRAGALMSFAGSLAIVWFWTKRLIPIDRRVDFFVGTVVFWLCMPVMLRFQSIAHNDHLFIFFGLLTAHFMALFCLSQDDRKAIWRYYYAACIALGFAGLAKYNAVFIGLGIAGWVVFTGRGRKLLSNINLWVGGAIAALMQAPVLMWNIQNDWPSFRYNLNDRIGQTNGAGLTDNITLLVTTTVMMFGPVFLIALFRFVMPAAKGEVDIPMRAVGRFVFIASTATFIALCATNTVLYYWNFAAYIFVLPVVLLMVRTRVEFGIHALFGLVVGAWIIAVHGLYPTYKHGGEAMRDSDISYGLTEIAQVVEAEEERLGVDFVMTTDYRTASLLSFSSKRTDIQKMGLRGDQFDFWFDQSGFAGKNALVLADDFLPVERLVSGVFENVTFIRDIKVEKFGFEIHSYKLYLAENYAGEGAF